MPGDADRDAGVDPRFDPMFQRGYDPKLHRRPARAAEPVREPRRAPEPPGAEPVERMSVREAAEAPEPLPRNPFRLALLVASVAAIAGSALVLWHQLQQDPYGGGYGTDVGELFATQFLNGLLVPLLTGGLIGLCLWLALGAVRRREDE